MGFPGFLHDLPMAFLVVCPPEALRDPQRGASRGLRGGRRAGHGARRGLRQ